MEILGDHNDKPEIESPCDWEYRLIGRHGDLIQEAVKTLIEKKHNLAFSHKSKSGKFISFILIMHVESEEERLRYFHLLNDTQVIMQIL